MLPIFIFAIFISFTSEGPCVMMVQTSHSSCRNSIVYQYYWNAETCVYPEVEGKDSLIWRYNESSAQLQRITYKGSNNCSGEGTVSTQSEGCSVKIRYTYYPDGGCEDKFESGTAMKCVYYDTTCKKTNGFMKFYSLSDDKYCSSSKFKCGERIDCLSSYDDKKISYKTCEFGSSGFVNFSFFVLSMVLVLLF